MDTPNTPKVPLGDVLQEDIKVTPEVISPGSLINPQTLLLTSLLVSVLLITIFFFISRRKSGAKGDSLLLVGPSDAGKTAILSTLVYEQTLQTHTSMQTNVANVAVGDNQKSMRVIDIPGHPRIRDQFKDYLSDAKAIAFVVDASTISRNGAIVAEHLHHILNAFMSIPPSQRVPALAILAHKADALKSSSTSSSEQLAVNRVRTILERELEKRRSSQAGGVGVESLGHEEEGSSELGGLDCTGGGEFKFAQWEGGEIVFLGTHVSVGKPVTDDEKSSTSDGLLPLREWLAEVV
ncbi:signal recognition particle receptor beta subunit-domain-containing protein [Abortiporus biennis]|nr:signal recognition particle receptor beta subunit-domain-containing protein [Abortiporus biennis]